jgi:hypothetical protein
MHVICVSVSTPPVEGKWCIYVLVKYELPHQLVYLVCDESLTTQNI